MKKQQIFWIVGLAVTLFLASVVSFYASASPDGLESVAHTFGFGKSAQDSAVADITPLNGYSVSGVDNSRLSTAIAGVLGVLITGAIAYLLFRFARRKQ